MQYTYKRTYVATTCINSICIGEVIGGKLYNIYYITSRLPALPCKYICALFITKYNNLILGIIPSKMASKIYMPYSSKSTLG